MDNEFKRFCMILHLCSNYIDSCSGDILIDLPNAWENYKMGNYPIFFIRKSGADLIDRFDNILITDGKPHEFKDCVEYAKKTLGVDFALEITPYKVILTKVSGDKWSLNDLETRLKWDIRNVGEVEVVDFNEEFVEKS